MLAAKAGENEPKITRRDRTRPVCPRWATLNHTAYTVCLLTYLVLSMNNWDQ